jgi:PilZ domain
VRRLRDRQDVTLLVGSTYVECRVIAVTTAEAALQPLLQPEFKREELSKPASLMFMHEGLLVVLKGHARWNDLRQQDLRFMVADGVQVPQQRRSSRLRIPLGVTVNGVSASTYDISADGLSLEGEIFGEPGAALDLWIEVPGEDVPLRTAGSVIRSRDGLTAVRFVGLVPRDRERLERFIFAVQRMLATGEIPVS